MQNVRSSFRIFIFVALSLATFSADAIQSFSFDWDDNIMTLLPEIILIRNDTNEEVLVSSKDFAVLRHQVGEGKTYRRKPEDATTTDQRFIDNFEKTLALNPSKWQAPMWKEFQRVTQTKEGAQFTSIITGRRNSAESFHKALRLLQAKGFIKHIPDVSMIFPVGNKTLFPGNSDVSLVKVDVMKRLLDHLNQIPMDTSGELHFWNFSDDDPENFRKACDLLQADVAKGRWAQIKISVTFSL